MKQETYYRRNLAATRNGIIDPLCMVEVWLEQISDLVNIPVHEFTSEEAFDAIVLYGRLIRSEKNLILGAGSEAEWRQIENFFEANMPALLQACSNVLVPDQWVVEAEEFLNDEDLPDLEATIWAERLVSDVDDMQLYAYFLGQPKEELENAIAGAFRFLFENREIACCCAVFIQTVAATIPEEICDRDFELGLTGELYGQMLDILEHIEESLGLSITTDNTTTTRRLDDSEWVFLPPEFRMAAATEEDIQVRSIDWSGPDGKHTATLFYNGTEKDHLTITFYEGDEAAVDLIGKIAQFAGVSSEINSDSNALFSITKLHEARTTNQAIVLRVDSVPWQMETIE